MRIAMSSSALPIPFTTSTVSQTHHHNYSSFLIPDQQACTPQYTHHLQLHQDTPTKSRTIRYRLSQLCKNGEVHLARQLFDSIPHPTTVLWNTIIIGYICNNLPHEAIEFYSRMKWTITSISHPHICDAYTYSSTLKACAEAKQLLIGKALHCHILRSNIFPSRILYNSLLNMYITCLLSSGNSSGCDLVESVFNTIPKRNVVAWNTMVSWHTKRGRFREAVEHFVMMMKIGIRPTAVSFVNVFRVVSGLGDAEIANLFYGMVIKLGSECANDLFVVSSAILMYSELGCLEFANKIFENCLEKNAGIWNTMIGGYIQNTRPVDALKVFFKALEGQDDDSIDEITFLSATVAASHLQQLDVAQQLHSYLIKNSLASSVILQNAIIALYSRCSCIYDSFKVFSGMQERDIVSWNTMITALIQNGLDNEGLMLIYEMQKQGLSIDDVTITALLSAASNLRNQDIGKETHAYLIRHGIQFDGIESYLIDMYAKSGLIEAAHNIFCRSCTNDSDTAIWNAMISANTQNGRIEQSFIVFRRMLEQNVMPNAVTLASILPACSHSGSVALGKLLHGFAIRNFLDINVFVSSALVDMYSKSGAIIDTEIVFWKSPEKNSVTFTNMISAYGQHGMGEKAITLFYSMGEYGINPDAVTFVAVLSSCSYTGLVDEGLKIFESMNIEYGIRPSTEHYACVVDMLGRVGRVVEAYNFVETLGEEGNTLGIWGSLLAACKIHRNFELGKTVASKLLEMEGADSLSGYHILLSNIHAEEGNWEYVNSVRNGMLERGLTKEIGCSWINISGYASYFVSRDKNHPHCSEIYVMLDRLTANMKDAGYRPPFTSSEGWTLELED
ncbi:pentatricopeptide repeat-containing At3g22150, chloroplastic [Olea europaea subsp. europaea]|uniref:Pentatricopeptide repeat-containing At3g22150, chloroplastic n=1 Tax=Olea europaea subsp. europaea TaxID=158383 RepID=A0A8S0RMH9_OLEEU|nr:pentatricopeptide repeat-containing At3g22150, chloroplastic [Olea europaea subsp. europaea]